VPLRSCLLALVFLFGAAGPGLAQDNPEFRGEYRDWRVFTRAGADGQICYALSRPADSAPQAHAHGNVYFLVATWQSGSVSEQPSLLVGYDLRPASPPEIRVGSSRYEMYTDGQEAFLDDLDDEPRLVRAMKRGSAMRVTATTSDGMATAYEFSLAGVTAALQRAQTLCN
jgi:hypothetical protein